MLVFVMLSVTVAWVIFVVMLVWEIGVWILVIDVRLSTDVIGVFCEVFELSGEVVGVLLVVVKLSVELLANVVDLICGVDLECCKCKCKCAVVLLWIQMLSFFVQGYHKLRHLICTAVLYQECKVPCARYPVVAL